jgi:hypothetical protein
MKVSTFDWRSDLETYFYWEQKMEILFEYPDYIDRTKVKLLILGFSRNALVWWEQVVANRRRMGENMVGNWELLKNLMRTKFMPLHYYNELYQRRLVLN